MAEMDTPQMLAHVKAGGFAKRKEWSWARIGWNPHCGPYRGDAPNLRHTDTWSILTIGDMLAEDWIAVDKFGNPL